MLKVMAELVIQNSNGNDVTTSLIVAQVFGKNHKDVLRDIEKLSCSEDFRVRNFAHTPYTHPQNGQVYHYYEMTKDGFSFLVMGYTGAKAGEFKEKFISEFNKREMMLKDDDYILMRSQQILQKRVEAAEQRVKALEADNQQKDAKIAKLQPKADFADAAFITDDKVDIGMAAKILKLGFGRNTLFQKLRQVGVFFSNRNEPKQRFVNAGYFEMKEKFIERNSHPGFVVTKILVTQKGLAYINHLFGGNPSDGKIAAIE
jgi:phage regulatory protein, rha family|nr:MAG TPA: KilAC domain protein [Caudoviricetes sp.]